MARPRIAEERREEILAAFERCVVRNGIDRTTLADIAEEAGQPRSLIRYFVGNRSDLVSRLVDRILERTEAQLRSLGEAPGANDAAHLVDFVMTDLFSDPVTTRLVAELWLVSARSEEVRERLSQLYRHVVDDMAARTAQEPDTLPDANRRDAVLALFSLGLGMTVLRQFGLEAVDPDGLRHTVRSLLTGPGPARASRPKKRI